MSEQSAENDAPVRVWPPSDWCAAINPERTHICDQPRGHEGDHSGWDLPIPVVLTRCCRGGTCGYCGEVPVFVSNLPPITDPPDLPSPGASLPAP